MKNTALALAACALLLSPLHASLIDETWEGYTDGLASSQFAKNGGIWSLESGASAGLQIVDYDASGSGKGLQVLAAGGTWVRVVSANGYSAPNGVSYGLQIKRLDDLQSFTRMRIQDSQGLSGASGYYLQATATGLFLTSIYEGGIPVNLGSWNFDSGQFVPDTTYNFRMEVLAVSTGNQVNVYFDNTRVISLVDTSLERLNLADSELYFGFDNRIVNVDTNNAKSVYGNIQVNAMPAIPEPSSAVLVLAVAGGLFAVRHLRRRSLK